MSDDERVMVEMIENVGGCTPGCGVRMSAGAPVRGAYCVVVEHCGGKVPVFLPGAADSETQVQMLLDRWAALAPRFHGNPGTEEDWRARLPVVH